MYKSPIERFKEKIKVNESTGCHEWTGHKDRYGYGRFGLKHRVIVLAHRWICEPIPEGMQVLHKCDNPSCVNKDHLFFGTRTDNMRDMVSKGRNADFRGKNNKNSKLSDDQIKSIRQDTRSQTKIAKDYGVGQTTISYIKTNKRWNHI